MSEPEKPRHRYKIIVRDTYIDFVGDRWNVEIRLNQDQRGKVATRRYIKQAVAKRTMNRVLCRGMITIVVEPVEK
jgi:hypothetical protein